MHLRPQTIRLRPLTRPLLRRCLSVGRRDEKLALPGVPFCLVDADFGVRAGESSCLMDLEAERWFLTGVRPSLAAAFLAEPTPILAMRGSASKHALVTINNEPELENDDI